jgi:hypothetical protein
MFERSAPPWRDHDDQRYSSIDATRRSSSAAAKEEGKMLTMTAMQRSDESNNVRSIATFQRSAWRGHHRGSINAPQENQTLLPDDDDERSPRSTCLINGHDNGRKETTMKRNASASSQPTEVMFSSRFVRPRSSSMHLLLSARTLGNDVTWSMIYEVPWSGRRRQRYQSNNIDNKSVSLTTTRTTLLDDQDDGMLHHGQRFSLVNDKISASETQLKLQR